MGYKFYSYRLDHDYGFAPNPFGPYCTLANCMQKIRSNSNLAVGNWIFGLGSMKLNNENHLIYAMEVSEKITYEDYWEDHRFLYKKPTANGSLKKLHGDNIYFKKDNIWNQLPSLHSKSNGNCNPAHLEKDLSGKYVLVSTNFYYFGKNSIPIPKEFQPIIGDNKRGFSGPKIPLECGNSFLEYLKKHYNYGVMGDPINWKEYDQLKLIL